MKVVVVSVVLVLLACHAQATLAKSWNRFLLEEQQPADHPTVVEDKEDNKIWMELSLERLRGLWFGSGVRMPSAVLPAFESNEIMPNCTANDYHSMDYKHFIHAPHYNIIVSDPLTGDLSIFLEEQASYVSRIANYSNNVFQYEPTEDEPEGSCYYWRPYVDTETGDLFTQVLYKWTFTRNADNTVTFKDESCNLTGNEVVGCFEGSSQDVTAKSNPEGTADAAMVTVVASAQFHCQEGECLKMSAKY